MAGDARAFLLIEKNTIRVFDLATLQERGALAVDFGGTISSWMVPGDKLVFTPLDDGTALTWDISQFTPRKFRLVHWPSDLQRWWADLADAKAKTAWAAVWRLAETPPEALLPFLRERLRPVPPYSVVEVAALVAGLDSPEFRARAAASRTLELAGYSVIPDLKRAARLAASAEVRDRLDALIAKQAAPVPPPETLRFLRALTVLEQVKTADARRLVEELSRGAETARETRAAVAALGRMPHPESWR